jgi:hypothetical protein
MRLQVSEGKYWNIHFEPAVPSSGREGYIKILKRMRRPYANPFDSLLTFQVSTRSNLGNSLYL